MLHLDLFDRRLGVLQEDAVVELDAGERAPRRGRGEAEQVGQERCGLLPVPRGDDRVIESYGHADEFRGHARSLGHDEPHRTTTRISRIGTSASRSPTDARSTSTRHARPREARRRAVRRRLRWVEVAPPAPTRRSRSPRRPPGTAPAACRPASACRPTTSTPSTPSSRPRASTSTPRSRAIGDPVPPMFWLRDPENNVAHDRRGQVSARASPRRRFASGCGLGSSSVSRSSARATIRSPSSSVKTGSTCRGSRRTRRPGRRRASRRELVDLLEHEHRVVDDRLDRPPPAAEGDRRAVAVAQRPPAPQGSLSRPSSRSAPPPPPMPSRSPRCASR